jgi:PAS domain S-box-containing protein
MTMAQTAATRAADSAIFSLPAAEARERLAAIVDSCDDAIISKTLDGVITAWNGGAEKIFGYVSSEVVGKPMLMLFPADRADEESDILRRIGQGKNVDTFETVRIRKDGSSIDVSVTISPIRDERGIVIGASKIARDITARKQAEKRLAQQAEELTRRMAELARSNADLEQFAYVASHDLQEPLRMVTAYTQLLAERYRGKLDANADRFMGYAIEGAQRMQVLIQDLLAFSRVGKQDLYRQKVDCGSVMKDVLRALAPSVAESAAVVSYGVLPVLWADRTLLAQVFQNLIGNAIKFRRQMPPVITVTAESNPREWRFRVSDNGIGIAAEHAENIFAVFQRLHARSEYPGNGIGLSICKKIVERYGGRIWVKSEIGIGSTFVFTIPSHDHGTKEVSKA